jgi:tRNA(Ile2) C34 agmatinyltransferase TiaS
MATIYRCDKCSRDQSEPLKTISIERDYDNSSYSKELCDNCLRRLNDWLKRDAVEAQSK